MVSPYLSQFNLKLNYFSKLNEEAVEDLEDPKEKKKKKYKINYKHPNHHKNTKNSISYFIKSHKTIMNLL